jgi:ArsR family transcriptional regulator
MAETSTSLDTASFESITSLGKAVGDPLRATILLALKADSLSVSELCSVFSVAQPALSHHLKILHTAGLVARRREGTSIFYRRDDDAHAPLKQALFNALDSVALNAELVAGLKRVHAERSRSCQAFFARNAADISSLQTQIAEPQTYTQTVLAMASRPGDSNIGHALEIGPGDGALIVGLAGLFREVTGIDSSAEMLAHTAQAICGEHNISLIHADFLEFSNEENYDLIVAAMAVHHLPSPAGFFHRARQLLKPGGSLIVAELTRHDQHWASEVCGDLWLGFEPVELERWAISAGLKCSESQFLAQKNGFQIQIQRYTAAGAQTPAHPTDKTINTNLTIKETT